eukprot:gene703-8955_t
MSHAMFPNGIYDLVQYYIMKTNKEAISKLQILIEKNNMTSQQIVTNAIKIRLELNQEFKKEFHEAMAIALLPENLISSMYLLGVFIDEVCHLANQNDANIDWYLKRGVLCSVYGMTEIYMLTDESENYQDTWKFLDERIQDGMFAKWIWDSTISKYFK